MPDESSAYFDHNMPVYGCHGCTAAGTIGCPVHGFGMHPITGGQKPSPPTALSQPNQQIESLQRALVEMRERAEKAESVIRRAVEALEDKDDKALQQAQNEGKGLPNGVATLDWMLKRRYEIAQDKALAILKEVK